MKFFGKYLGKNSDFVKSSQFIVAFLWFLAGPLLIAGLTAGRFPLFAWLMKGGIIILLFMAFALAALVVSFADKTGGFFLGLVGPGERSFRNLREQLSGELTVAREDRNKGRYDLALQRVNTYLEQDPEYAEALYLKAQILWEGFERGDEAREYLIRIINSIPKDESINRWARKTYAEIRNAEIS